MRPLHEVRQRPVIGVDEPVYYHFETGDYSGALPTFYEGDPTGAVGALTAGCDVVCEEVGRLMRDQPDAFTVNFTPGGYREPGWRTLNLVTDRFRYHRNRALLPKTTALVDGLPGLSFAPIAIREPGCELASHHGDTNIMYRLHLGLHVPADLPEVGIRVGSDERAWAEGEVLAFEDAHLHSVWNHSSDRRVVLVVDVLKEELVDRRRWLCARAGSGIVVQLLLAKVPGMSRMGSGSRRAIGITLATVVWAMLPFQRHGPSVLWSRRSLSLRT